MWRNDRWILWNLAFLVVVLMEMWLANKLLRGYTTKSRMKREILSVQRNKQPLGKNALSKPKILLWTTMWLRSGKEAYFIDNQTLKGCPVQCDFLDDKRELKESDAVVFHARDLAPGSSERIPSRLRNSQIYIFFTQENPTYHPNWHFVPNGVFNWTMTYRSDSDVLASFGSTESQYKPATDPREERLRTSNFTLPLNQLTKYKELYLKPKRKLVAWIASNCITQSRREQLVEELRKYIPVDIYGLCGTKKCRVPRRPSRKTLGIFDCYRQVGNRYKFYLSFENSLCSEYVTEKFFLPLKNNMVPIVFGAANYKAIAPPNSHINVRDYRSVKDLVNYIQYLDRNDTEYLAYFQWKENYHVKMRNKYCNLCQKLWTHSVTTASGRVTIDPRYIKLPQRIEKWWTTTADGKFPACYEPKRIPLIQSIMQQSNHISE